MAVTESRTGPDRATVAAFVSMVVMAGGNGVAVRYVSCEGCELAPFWAAGTRFLLATVIFAVIALALRSPMPRGRALTGAVLYGALTFGGGFGLGYLGFVHAPAGLGSVLLATLPLLTFLLALAHRLERFRWERLAGAALALGGTAVIFGSGLHQGVPFFSLIALLGASVCFAEGIIVVKTFPAVHPAASNAIGMAAGTVILFAVSVIRSEAYVIPRQGSTWAAQVYLVILGSIGVFGLYLFLLERWTASAVSYEGVLIPVVAILLSAWLQHERITAAFVVGTIVIFIGVYFGALRQPSPG